MPCTRIVGGVPTRMWRSEAPSDTTNCNRSDIEYDMREILKSSNYVSIKIDSHETHLSRGKRYPNTNSECELDRRAVSVATFEGRRGQPHWRLLSGKSGS